MPESTEDRTIGGVTAIARPKAVAATSAADGSLSAEVDNRRLQAGCPDHGGAGILPNATKISRGRVHLVVKLCCGRLRGYL